MSNGNAVVSRTHIESLSAEGAAFESSAYFSVPANGEYWYRVRIPAERVIATYNRLWVSNLAGCKLEIFGTPVGGTLGSVWGNSNKNRRSNFTSAVEIHNYTTAPTVEVGVVDDFIPAGPVGTKSQGGYLPQATFRVYLPGDYAIKLTNPNNQACVTKIGYEWLDVPNEMALY